LGTVILTFNHGIGSLGQGNVVHDGPQAIEVGGVKGASQSAGQGAQTLELEADAESVETLINEVVNRPVVGN